MDATLGDRPRLIRALEKERGSRVLVYFLGTRQGAATQMGMDQICLVRDHLSKMGKCPRLDVFLYTSGGDVHVPPRLAQLLLEYAQEFHVLVPHRAHSAGTMLCLAAKEIVMGPMGELGPVDPTTTSPFNPKTPEGQPVPISVEDLNSYLSLAQEAAGLKGETPALEAFKLLVQQVHPLSLGHVNRVIKLAKEISKKQLVLQKNGLDKQAVDRIVEHLTSRLYSHNYAIPRKEAGSFGLHVVSPPESVEKLMWQLYEAYETETQMNRPFDPVALIASKISFPNATVPPNLNLQLPPGVSPEAAQAILGQIQRQLSPSPVVENVSLTCGVIESLETTHNFVARGKVSGQRKFNGELTVDVQLSTGWETPVQGAKT